MVCLSGSREKRQAFSPGAASHFVGLHPCERCVEHGVFGFLDRRVGVIDLERRIGFGVVRPGLGPVEVDLGLLGIDVLADRGDVLVPCPLNVVPPVRDVPLACLGRLARAASLGLGRRASVVDLSRPNGRPRNLRAHNRMRVSLCSDRSDLGGPADRDQRCAVAPDIGADRVTRARPRLQAR